MDVPCKPRGIHLCVVYRLFYFCALTELRFQGENIWRCNDNCPVDHTEHYENLLLLLVRECFETQRKTLFDTRAAW